MFGNRTVRLVMQSLIDNSAGPDWLYDNSLLVASSRVASSGCF